MRENNVANYLVLAKIELVNHQFAKCIIRH